MFFWIVLLLIAVRESVLFLIITIDKKADPIKSKTQNENNQYCHG